jgi:acetylornithine/N-succinyldiaminopimelate aminotransferase
MDPVLQSVIENDSIYYMNTFGKRIPVCLTHGEGIFVYGSDGKRYMDLIGGIAVNVLGHAHPRLTAAIARQSGRLIHCSNLFYNEVQTELAEKLVRLSPGMDRVFFSNSGAEANETAIKLARIFHEKQGRVRPGIISATNSFHGRTLATVTATGQYKYHHPFRPLPEGFSYVPYNDTAALDTAIHSDTAAVILEIIQGEGGIIPASEAYAKKVESLCEKHGALLIIDEIQTGLGRTGTFYAYEAYGISPDIVTLAKGLGGGVPIAATLASDRVARAFSPGDHGSTFGGNPLACAAALAVLEEMETKNLVSNVKDIGKYLLSALQDTAKKTGRIKEIRGKGLMIGIELTDRNAVQIRQDALAQGYLINSIGDAIIRLLPPLIIDQESSQKFCVDFETILTSSSS